MEGHREPAREAEMGEGSRRDKGKGPADEVDVVGPTREDEGFVSLMAELTTLSRDLEALPPRTDSLRSDILKHHLAVRFLAGLFFLFLLCPALSPVCQVIARVNQGMVLAEEEDRRVTDAANHLREERDRLQAEVFPLREKAAASDTLSAEVESLKKALKAAKRRSKERGRAAEEEKERAEDEKERADKLEKRTAEAEKDALDARLALFLAKDTIGDLELEVGRLGGALEDQRRGEERRVIEARENAVAVYQSGPSFRHDAGLIFRPQLLALLKALVEELGLRVPGFDPRSLDVLRFYFNDADKEARDERVPEGPSSREGSRPSSVEIRESGRAGSEGPRVDEPFDKDIYSDLDL